MPEVNVREDIFDISSDGSEHDVTVVEHDNDQGRQPSSSPEVVAVITNDRPGVRTGSLQPIRQLGRVAPPLPPARRTTFLPKAESAPDLAGLPKDLKGSVEEILVALQKIISSIPKDDGSGEPLGHPKLLKVPLYGHQLYGLKWLWWREHEKPYGGILGDLIKEL